MSNEAERNALLYKAMSPPTKLSVARCLARNRMPYFSAALNGLIPRPDTSKIIEHAGGAGLAVTAGMVLLVDYDEINRWPLEMLAGVLLHEVGHILRDHSGRAQAASVMTADERYLFNVAGDCEINDDLAAAFPTVFRVDPKDELAPQMPAVHGFPDGLTAEAYYQMLREKADAQPKMPCSCGSGAGQPMDGEPGSGEGDGGEGDGKEKKQGDGSGGGAERGRSLAEVERIRRQVAEDVKAADQKGRGNVPGGWLRWAETATSPPKVRWQDKLARTLRGAVAWRPGAVDYRHTHLSRRQAGIGYGPGKPMLPALRQPVPNVAVIADTSGSMSEHELGIGLREARGILMGVGARVTFAACDAAVHSLKPVSSWAEIPKLLVGGGGTDFGPAFEALAAMRKNRPDFVVFFTDGDGACPEAPPPGMKVIWLLTGAHAHSPCDWGEQIKLED